MPENSLGTNIAVGIVAGFAVAAGALVVVNTPTPISADEWQDYVQMVDYEIKKTGGTTIKNVKGREDLTKRFNQKILERPVQESTVELREKTYTKEEYEALRADLIQKSDKAI